MTAATSTRNAMADLWGLLSELLSFPGPGLEEEVRRGTVRGTVAHLAEHLGWSVPAAAFTGLSDDLLGESLETEFIRLFDVPDGATTPLYTGVYSRRRRDAMEELLRFYRHFGLTVSTDGHDLPDYVPTVLEFLRVLALRAALEPPGNAADMAAADVISRHLQPWAVHTAQRLGGRAPHPLYAGVVSLVEAACALQLARVAEPSGEE